MADAKSIWGVTIVNANFFSYSSLITNFEKATVWPVRDIDSNLNKTDTDTVNPSFDCSKASNFAEKSVCENIDLAKLDSALSQNYKAMYHSDIGEGARENLKKTQRAWVIKRNECPTIECLIDIYSNRVNEICDYPVLSGMFPLCIYSEDIL